MLLIYGKRTARIKKETDNSQSCKTCKTFDMKVSVYRSYYHLFFIPFVPSGDKTVYIRCKQCGEPLRMDSLQKQYEKSTRTPFYLYSFLFLIAALIISLIISNSATQKEKALFVGDPKVGDVYLINTREEGKSMYYFLRINKTTQDSVEAYHNNLMYSRFVSRFRHDDFFDSSEVLGFTRGKLKEMLEKSEITAVERVYGSAEGFNRLK